MITVFMYTNYMVYHKRRKLGAFNEFAYFTKLCKPKALRFADILDKFSKLYAAKFIAIHLPNFSRAKLLSFTISHDQFIIMASSYTLLLEAINHYHLIELTIRNGK